MAKFVGVSTVALTAAMMATSVYAADAPASPTDVSAVIVTGTRTTGLKASDSSAPIQVLDSGSLKRVGQSELIQALAQNVPSFTAQAVGGDAANLTLSARLRGLSPNDTLVLINGKRRHGTSNLAVLGGPYQGGAAPDLNYIPLAAIDHVEVLTDGAAAQYGSDAIAGVVNIIMKKTASGGSVTLNGGQYMDEGGKTAGVSFNAGFAPLGDKSWFNVTLESRFHGHSDRGNIDPRVYNHDTTVNIGPGGQYANAVLYPTYPHVNPISGDAMYHLNVASFDAGYSFDGGTELYSFGTYGHKNGQAFENYRTPNKAPSIWPNGFRPKEELQEDDFAFTAGIRGTVMGWKADLSTTYGKDVGDFYTVGSANNELAALGLKQTSFFDGTFEASQWTNNLDFSREFNVGAATPLSVAFGIEQRRDNYVVTAGEPNSYNGSGAASFPGLTPLDAGDYSRDNTGVYADFSVSPVTALKLDAAVRFEHFSDFGDTTIGKLTGRYDFSPMIALRGTVSTGFRAPTQAEEYYTNVNVGPNSAFGQFAPNSSAAKALGLSPLKPEKSTNYSFGAVLHPMPKVTATIDAFQITIKDRIVGSSDLYGYQNGTLVSAAVHQALVNFAGAATVAGDQTTGVDVFTNGVNTETNGVDFVINYSESYGNYGHVDWSLSGDFNTTKVKKVKAAPAVIGQELVGANAIAILEKNNPEYRIVAGALWTLDKYTVNLRESFYGQSSGLENGYSGTFKNTVKPAAITDLELAYQATDKIKISVGANNLFNTYPDRKNAALVGEYIANNDNGAVSQYPDFSPFGINGGYYYGRVTYNF
jgi:iron complex outermembrane receptor protein